MDTAVLGLGIPTLGICYGMQVMARDLGGTVESNDISEYGKADAELGESALFHDLPAEQVVWMSHRDSVTAASVRRARHGLVAVHADRRFRGRGTRPLRRPVPPRGRPYTRRPADPEELPLRGRRSAAELDPGGGDRGAGRADPRPGRHRSGSSAGCPAASTRRSPRCSCTRPSATSSHACSSTTG